MFGEHDREVLVNLVGWDRMSEDLRLKQYRKLKSFSLAIKEDHVLRPKWCLLYRVPNFKSVV